MLRFPFPVWQVLSAGLLLASPSALAHVVPVGNLLTPESAVQAKDGKVYISEINGFGVDGDGQISVTYHGKTEVLLRGLDDPKGLIIIEDTLYIADNARIWRVDLKQTPAKAEVFVAAGDFPKTPQFLNDLTADGLGNLYVSDSGDILGSGKGGAIYKITPQRKLSLVIDGMQDERILAPNGLLSDGKGEHLLLVDFTSGVLYDYNQNSKQLQEIASGFGGGDGLVRRASKDLYVSDWKSGKVFRVTPEKTVSLVKEGLQSAADIALSQDGKQLMIPDMKAGTLVILPLQ